MMGYVTKPFTSIWNYFFHHPTPVEKEAIENVKLFHQKFGSKFSIDKKPSKGEKVIQKVLEEKKLIYHTEYSFKDLIGCKAPLRFDFAVIYKDRLCLIEFQGGQHYHYVEKFHVSQDKFKQQQEYDQKKREYCKKHKIQYLEFDYTQEKILEELVNKHFK